jgi:hypothetical protein
LDDLKQKFDPESKRLGGMTKCIRSKPERLEMVLRFDEGMDRVEDLMNKALINIFIGKQVKGGTLR